MALSISDILYGELGDLDPAYQGSISDRQYGLLSDESPPGGGGGDVAAADITDATAIGISLITAETILEALTAIELDQVENTQDADKPISDDTQDALDLKAPIADPTFTGTVGGVTKGHVGLGNADNTSDATKNSATATLTNKRITKRLQSEANPATLTITSDDVDVVKVTALAQAMTIAAPTGTPTPFQGLVIRIKDNGTGRALTWNAAFRAIGITLPTTTVANKTTYVGTMWNAEDSKWDAIATVTEA